MGWIHSPEHLYRLYWLFYPTKLLPSASQYNQSYPTPLTSKCCYVGGGFGKPLNRVKNALKKDTCQCSAPACSGFTLSSQT